MALRPGQLPRSPLLRSRGHIEENGCLTKLCTLILVKSGPPNYLGTSLPLPESSPESSPPFSTTPKYTRPEAVVMWVFAGVKSVLLPNLFFKRMVLRASSVGLEDLPKHACHWSHVSGG